MRKSIFSKLSRSFVGLSIVIVMLMMVLINSSFKRAFESYLIGRSESQVENIVDEIVNIYESGEFSEADTASLRRLANRNKYDIRILDSYGQTIAEVKARNTMHKSHMTGRFRDQPLEYNVIEFQRGDIRIEIGHMGDYVFDKQEALFQRNIQMTILLGGGLLILFSIAISYMISKKLSYPIRAIKAVAEKIESGKFSFKYLGKASDPIEIYELSESINSMSDRLRYQEELRRQLTSDMAHEIRTPLTIIQGQLEAMMCGVWDLNMENIASVYEELARMNLMVDKLKDIHSLESKVDLLTLRDLDLKAEIESIVRFSKPIFIDKKIEIGLNLEEGLLLKADRDKFKQVLYNLLTNAVKYSKENSKVVINLYKEAQEGMVIIEVADEGIGIAKEDLANIFERFYRCDKSRSKEEGGLGLGLAITRALIEGHGWEVEVESQEGMGSTFKIKIPKEN